MRRLPIVISLLILCYPVFRANAQTSESSETKYTLTVDKIMRDPKWIGSSPRNAFWAEDGSALYFYWNPEQADSDSLYRVPRNGGEPAKLTRKERLALPSRYGSYNKDKSKKVFEKNGDIFIYDIKSNTTTQVTNTVESESNPGFTGDEKKIWFLKDSNIFLWDYRTGKLTQLSDFKKGKKKEKKDAAKSDHEKWLQKEELTLIRTLKERKEKRENSDERRDAEQPERPLEIFTGGKRVQQQQLSPDENFITYSLVQSPKDEKNTIIPNYITEEGFTEDIRARNKVGSPRSTYEFFIYDIKNDTVYSAQTDSIPGIFEQPEYLQDYQNKTEEDSTKNSNNSSKKKARNVYIKPPVWSENGTLAVVDILSSDNKDRWIMLLDIRIGALTELDHQHDEAWIGGPGIRSWRLYATIGWMPDNRRIWFQSEETGYSHLYTVDVKTGAKKALTRGQYEVYSPFISRDKKHWYFTANKPHPGVRHFYRMPLNGGEPTQITTKTGRNQVVLSPDEKTIALSYSYSNKPWELYLKKNQPGAKTQQITRSLSQDFLSYDWREPEIITFEARDGAEVHARLYTPDNSNQNVAAVLFVHGAGYLQNAHKWWSSYFREYMFHNMLVDLGYTVLDIDYRGSAGYGRDWRTAIYRHMGGKDLTDHVDGARFLVENYNIDAERIGIYGGSYGGFITLMAMFTEPDVFAAGAALRPVTDWAHYNHGYTSNILNIPYTDSLAYVRSSPIYHAEGLKGALLICHGIVDVNVHIQDSIRLTQRLIELGQENWELAVYPMEGHGFREPSSWTDEYKRIFKLFEQHLK